MRTTTGKHLLWLSALLLSFTVLSACGTDEKQSSDAETKTTTEAQNDSTDTSSDQESAKTEEEAAAYPIKLTDELGHEVTLPAKPLRIFAPMLEDQLISLDILPIAQWSNGVEPQNYLQDKLGSVPALSFASGLPSAEQVLAYKPDLIVLHNKYYAEKGIYEQYSKIAPTYVFDNASANVNSSIEKLGTIVGAESQAEAAITAYANKVADAKEKLASSIEGHKAVIIRFNAKGMFFMNGDYYSGAVLSKELGFAQSEVVTGGALEVSLEILPELDADYIFLVNDGHQGDSALKELKDSALWQSASAVKAGHVFETTSDYWLSGGYNAQGKVIDDVIGFLQQ
ncbi:ABC transporter substrate-binding protein [Paenibacillus cellulosilyticus]|nr:ABC transporter substrate-binding protein [Paenibacillus cellulosilyticus]QKS44769.1 ABC transporter substrate-binding protein [Paenibacillus cellulosilyticus]